MGLAYFLFVMMNSDASDCLRFCLMAVNQLNNKYRLIIKKKCGTIVTIGDLYAYIIMTDILD